MSEPYTYPYSSLWSISRMLSRSEFKFHGTYSWFVFTQIRTNDNYKLLHMPQQLYFYVVCNIYNDLVAKSRSTSKHNVFHYSVVTWTTWSLKSSATLLLFLKLQTDTDIFGQWPSAKNLRILSRHPLSQNLSDKDNHISSCIHFIVRL